MAVQNAFEADAEWRRRAQFTQSTGMHTSHQMAIWLAKGREPILAEYFTMLLQAGADSIQTYVAGDLADWILRH